MNFAEHSEITGSNVTREQLQRLYSRYRFAASYCKNKDVLEVACGSGQGLGCLEKQAKTIIGGDGTLELVEMAKKHYGNRIRIDHIDAHKLPYTDHSFDVVILYEAIYFLQDPALFIKEAKRVLRENGTLIICSANRDVPGFSPCKLSHRYYSIPELYELLQQYHFHVEMFADCAINSNSLKNKLLHSLQKIAAKYKLIPSTMNAKEKLKRLFFGKLISLPPELSDGAIDYHEPIFIAPNKINRTHKVFFAVGTLGKTKNPSQTEG